VCHFFSIIELDRRYDIPQVNLFVNGSDAIELAFQFVKEIAFMFEAVNLYWRLLTILKPDIY
jgi:hypothetical protein